MKRLWLLVSLLFIVLGIDVCSASAVGASDEVLSSSGSSKNGSDYHTRVNSAKDMRRHSQCGTPSSLHFEYSVSIGSPIFSSMTLVPSGVGYKQSLVLGSLEAKLYVLNAVDGHVSFFHSSRATDGSSLWYHGEREYRSSPIVYGNKFLWISSSDAVITEIMVDSREGANYDVRTRQVRLPRLRVRFDWFTPAGYTKHSDEDDEEEDIPQQGEPFTGEVPSRKGKVMTRMAKESFFLFTNQQFVGDATVESNDDRVPFVSGDSHGAIDGTDSPIVKDDVLIDPHVLSNPLIEGSTLFVPVSFFFDDDSFEAYPQRFNGVPPGIDLHMYTALGIMAIDADTLHRTKWFTHLAMSSSVEAKRAISFCQPLITHLRSPSTGWSDRKRIVQAASTGFVYVLDSLTGDHVVGFPFEARYEVQATPTIVDGHILVIDTHGYLYRVDGSGITVFSALLDAGQPFIASSCTIVNSNTGVVGSISGNVYFFDVNTGIVSDVVRLADSGGNLGIVASIVPLFLSDSAINPTASAVIDETKLHHQRIESSKNPMKVIEEGKLRLHVAVLSLDGYISLIDVQNACIRQRLDIGEQVYATPIVADVLHTGTLQLVIGTMSGYVHVIETHTVYHPSLTFNAHQNGPFQPYGREQSQSYLESFRVFFTDGCKTSASNWFHMALSRQMHLEFAVTGGPVVESEFQTVEFQAIVFIDNIQVYSASYRKKKGKIVDSYIIDVPVPPHVSVGVASVTIEARMTSFPQESSIDSMIVPVSLGTIRLVKFLVVIPFGALVAFVFLMSKHKNN